MKPSAPSQTHLAELEPPVRLLAGGGSAFERQLVESADVDSIPTTSFEHLARALEVPSAALPATPLGEVLCASHVARAGSFVGLGAIGFVAAFAALRSPAPVAFEAAGATTPPIAAVSVEATPAAEMPTIQLRPSALLAASDTSEMSAPSSRIAVPRAASKPPASVHWRAVPAPATPARAPTSPVTEARGLRAELLALEAVQSALRTGRTLEAARALAEYMRRFPRAELGLEAELLGIDVLLASGEQERARAQARQLLARPDAARYRERLDALSESAGRDSAPHRARGSETVVSSH